MAPATLYMYFQGSLFNKNGPIRVMTGDYDYSYAGSSIQAIKSFRHAPFHTLISHFHSAHDAEAHGSRHQQPFNPSPTNKLSQLESIKIMSNMLPARAVLFQQY